MTGTLENLDERIKEGEEEIKQKRAYVSSLKQRRRDLSNSKDKREKVLIGAVIKTRAKKDQGFGELIRKVLLEGITRDCDREVFPDLFPGVVARPRKNRGTGHGPGEVPQNG